MKRIFILIILSSCTSTQISLNNIDLNEKRFFFIGKVDATAIQSLGLANINVEDQLLLMFNKNFISSNITLQWDIKTIKILDDGYFIASSDSKELHYWQILLTQETYVNDGVQIVKRVNLSKSIREHKINLKLGKLNYIGDLVANRTVFFIFNETEKMYQYSDNENTYEIIDNYQALARDLILNTKYTLDNLRNAFE